MLPPELLAQQVLMVAVHVGEDRDLLHPVSLADTLGGPYYGWLPVFVDTEQAKCFCTALDVLMEEDDLELLKMPLVVASKQAHEKQGLKYLAVIIPGRETPIYVILEEGFKLRPIAEQGHIETYVARMVEFGKAMHIPEPEGGNEIVRKFRRGKERWRRVTEALGGPEHVEEVMALLRSFPLYSNDKNRELFERLHGSLMPRILAQA